MNKTTLLLATCILGVSAFQINNVKCQTPIVITEADMAVAGDKFLDVADSTHTVMTLPIPTGANVTWNYLTLGTTDVDTIKAFSPAPPYSTFFPLANIEFSFSQTNLKYSFLNDASGQETEYGVVTQIFTNKVVIKYEPHADTINIFPETYNHHWRGGYVYRIQFPDTSTVFDSTRVLDFTQYYDTVPAWGMVTTPYKTDSVILKLTVERHIDSTFHRLDSNGKWVFAGVKHSGDSTYDWRSNGIGYALLSCQVQGGKITVANWLKGTNTGINEITDKAGSLVYPNPAQTVLNIKLASCITGYVKIMDMTGREISTSQFSNKLANINTTQLNNGIYFYRVYDKSDKLVDTGKFSVAK